MITTRKPFRKSNLALAAMLVAGVAPTHDALAVSCTWTPSTGNWGSAGNWSCGAVPTGPNGDSATIGSGKTVTVNTAQSIYTLVNAGAINIDAFTLTLQGGGSTVNSGTINIGGPSTAALQMSNDINNTGGVINIAAGSVLNQFSGAITSGTINMVGTGMLTAASNGSNILSGVTLNGVLDASSIANARERIGNGMVLNGAVNIANGGIVSFDSSLGANNSISGAGTFNLNDANARISIEGTGNTTLGSSIVIHGQGAIGQAILVGGTNVLTNNGLISADVAGGSLTLQQPGSGGSIVNNGTLRAINGASLVLSTNIANNGGQISAQNASSVVQSGVSVSGGSIATGGSGAFMANSSGANFLDGVTVTGLLDLTTIANARERIINGATVDGTVNIANGGILSLDSSATAGANQTFGGTATINLNDPNARISIEGTGITTLGNGVTICGQGLIGSAVYVGGNNTLINNGLISSDVSGGTLNIVSPASGGSFVNNGTLQAINGATLLLSTNVNANAGSRIVAGAGSAVVQNGVTINGLFASSGGGLFTVSSSGANFLDGVNFTGPLDLTSVVNARERIVNGATVNGSINVANGGILSLDSSATSGANQTINGTVAINLNDPNARLTIEGAGITTLGSGVTIRGQGLIGQAIIVGGNNTLINNGLISSDVSGGTLNITNPASGGSFVNNGTIRAINGGTLLLSTNINANAGSQIIAGAGSAVVQNGVTVNGMINASGSGVFTVSSSGANFLDGVNFTGSLDLSSIVNARERIIDSATFNGTVNIGNGGFLSFDSTFAADQTLGGTVSINLNDPSARVTIEGAGSTTLGSGVTIHGQGFVGGAVIVGGVNTLVNNGLISADAASGTLTLQQPGSSGSVVNNSTLQAINGGTLVLSTNVDNSAGLITAKNGSAVLQNGVSIVGGTIGSVGTGAVQVSSNGANFFDHVTISGLVDMTTVTNSRERIINGATINGSVNVGNGGFLSLDSSAFPGGVQTIGGTGVINLNDASARLTIEGTGTTTFGAGLTVRGQGNIGQAVMVGGNNMLVNNGTIVADGGTLTISAPASGNLGLVGTGALQTSGGTLNLATGIASTQGLLVMGGTGSVLNLNTQNLTITNDYTNAQSGSGNAFDRRAGVQGTGLILSGGNAAQSITGAGVTGGATPNATLTLNNVHVGATTYNYQIANTGTNGPSLRGAIQTSVNGASLTDARLSGSGVTAGTYNTGAPGSNTGNLAVTFTAANAGALTPLSGQAVNLTSNFSNIADQKLNIVLGAGASAYNLANGSAGSPVAIANQRVGGSNAATLAVANVAPGGSFSEDLNASVGGTSGAAIGSGAISGRLAGTSDTGIGAITVGVDTTSSGAKAGTVTVNYVSTGTVAGVSNGLGTTSVGTQAVTVNGSVFQAATGALQTAALNFGTVQVGQSVSQTLVIRNTATGAAGFVEDLNASFGSATGTGASLISGSGSLSGILAGTNSNAANGTMTVSVNTAAAGVVAGGIAVNYQTAGAVNGVSNGLGTASAGSQNYGVAGTIQAQANVINQASPLVNTPTIDLGARRVGDAAAFANVSVTNVPTATPQAALNASISSNGAPVTASGGFNLLTPGNTSTNALSVGLSTATAGNFTGSNAGSATIAFVSDASNVGGCAPNCQLALASQQVSVSGKVYTAAAAQLNTGSVDFGIVHVGDTVAAQGVSVSNTAALSGLNDVLRGSIGGASPAFTATGTLAGVAAQGTDAGSLQVGLNTAFSGVFTGSATANFASHNADMSDLALGARTVALSGQVNNYAQASLTDAGGAATLSQSGHTYTLDFGTVLLGGASLTDTLAVLNSAAGLADLLAGSFDVSGVGSEFSLSGFGAFSGLAAGYSQGGLTVTFESGALGSFDDVIVLHAAGSNASGYNGALGDTTLFLRGNVVNVAAVPEPGTNALIFVGLLALVGVARSKRAQRTQRVGPAG